MPRTLPIALAALSFLVTTTLLRRVLPPPERFEGGEKLEYLRAHPGEYTALILGSSGIFRGLDPKVLDPEVQRVEPTFRSFNLGARWLRGYEADFLLRAAVEAAGDGLRWVILEPQDWAPNERKRFLETERSRNWHDWRQTRAAIGVSLAMDAPVALRWHWAWFHLRTYLYRLANYGELARLRRAVLGSGPAPYMSAEQIRAGAGYLSIEDSYDEDWRQRNAVFLAGLDEYRRAVAELRAGAPRSLAPAELALQREQRDWLEARGLEVIYVAPPFANARTFGAAFAAAGVLPNYIGFLDPDAYPDLYAVDARLDQEHLKAEAAAVLSQRCGERIARILEEGRAR